MRFRAIASSDFIDLAFFGGALGRCNRVVLGFDA